MLNKLQEIDKENEYFLFECKNSGFIPENPKWKKVLIQSRLPGTIWQQIILPGYLTRYNIEVLWAPEQTCPFLLNKKIKVITTIHDFATLRFPETCRWTNNLIFRLTFSFTLRSSDYLIPVSEYVKRELQQYYPWVKKDKKIETVSNGSPDWKLPEFCSNSGSENYLFFAGNLEPRKNLIKLIKALEILHTRGRDVKLHIAGPKGWKNSDLLKKIRLSPISGNIQILGFLTEKELQEQYFHSCAVIFPSIYEGFGLPVLEALKLNILVLTSKNTVMEEIAGSAAIYFDPNDENDIAEKIALLDDPSFDREYYLRNKNEILQKYSWEISANKLLLMFKI